MKAALYHVGRCRWRFISAISIRLIRHENDSSRRPNGCMVRAVSNALTVVFHKE
jgi:hypothetical protein